jgi:hypothetical protein
VDVSLFNKDLQLAFFETDGATRLKVAV